MRKILFKGKRKDNGEWVEGFYFKRDEHNHYIGDGQVPAQFFYEVIPETVGQFTGLTDKNGKQIFEGDIVEHHVQGDILVNRGVVNWDKENARWAYQLNTMNPCFVLYNPKAFDVISNIHDNPELLRSDNSL